MSNVSPLAAYKFNNLSIDETFNKYFPDAKEIFDLIRPDPLASFDRFIRWRYHMEDRTDLRMDQLLLEVDYLECRTRPVEETNSESK